MPPEPSVRVERSATVWTVILARPEVRNAVDGPTATALVDAFRAFDGDPEARVAVLWGEGGHFCAGADLHAFGSERQNRVAEGGDGPMGPTRLYLSKPVIAAVSGYAVAGGLELACWCDLRVAEEDAVFGVFCRRLGIPLVDGATVRLPRLVGLSRALDLIVTGRALGAVEAHAWGLVQRLVGPGEALPEALRLAAEIASHPPATLANDRHSTLAALGLPEAEAMTQELRLGLDSLASGEAAAGVERFGSGAGRGGQLLGAEAAEAKGPDRRAEQPEAVGAAAPRGIAAPASEEPLRVVGAAIIDGDHCLVTQRGPQMPLADRWELPGGKVEAGEDPRQALEREIAEELGIAIDVGAFLGRGTATSAGRLVILDVYLARWRSGEIALVEHRAWRWVAAEELSGLDWAPADRPVLPALAERLRSEERP